MKIKTQLPSFVTMWSGWNGYRADEEKTLVFCLTTNPADLGFDKKTNCFGLSVPRPPHPLYIVTKLGSWVLTFIGIPVNPPKIRVDRSS